MCTGPRVGGYRVLPDPLTCSIAFSKILNVSSPICSSVTISGGPQRITLSYYGRQQLSLYDYARGSRLDEQVWAEQPHATSARPPLRNLLLLVRVVAYKTPAVRTPYFRAPFERARLWVSRHAIYPSQEVSYLDAETSLLKRFDS